MHLRTLVGSLYSGYVVANVLKWYWWRFNGYGYFWGMLSGIVGAMAVPWLTETCVGHPVNLLYTFPAILVLSTLGSVVGALSSEPEDDAILIDFYRKVKPWGAWGPIRAKVLRSDPAFRPNLNLRRDIANVAVGIVWQLSFVTLAIYLVLRDWNRVARSAAVLAATTAYLKFQWLDRIQDRNAGA